MVYSVHILDSIEKKEPSVNYFKANKKVEVLRHYKNVVVVEGTRIF